MKRDRVLRDQVSDSFDGEVDEEILCKLYGLEPNNDSGIQSSCEK